jgi:prepilin-type N-terminal cleavage/methylation domain-containing protein
VKRRKGFTLIELLVVVAIIALLISILLPSLSRARELSKRLVCAANAKGIGTSCKIYANENEEAYPIPEFSKTDLPDLASVIYFNRPTTQEPNNSDQFATDPAPGRCIPSTLNTTTLSPTRAFWMFIRTGDNTPKQYMCPSSGDTTDPTDQIDLYYDFRGISYVSYGYQVPFGPASTRPSEGLDTRMVLAADKGPYGPDGSQQDPSTANPALTEESSPNDWKPYNSANHGPRRR